MFALDVLDADDPKMVRNMESLRDTLWIDTDVGGMARYEDDYYHRVSEDVPGNTWLITTMWYGKWLVATADSVDDLAAAKDVINWVVERSTSSGLLPEQLDPYSGDPVSVSPLTWSHSTYIGLVQD
ncbi:MAG: glycoside hydrolase family 15 protein, partial [Halobacteriaceae archaeon]